MSLTTILELPSKWTIVEVGKVARIVYGKGLPSEQRAGEGGIPVFGSSGVIGEHNKALYSEPSIIIGRKGTVGSIYYVSSPFWCIDTAFYLDSISSSVDIEFLAHALRKIDLSRFSITVGVPGINRNDIARTQIPLPPLPEQRQIVAILREADEIRCLRKQANEKCREFLQSVFFELFGNPDPKLNDRGWEIVKLEDFLEVGTGGTPSRSNLSYYGGTYAWVKTTELCDSIITSTEETITEAGLKFSNAKIYPENTILLAMYGQGQTRGRTAKLGIPAATNQACAAFLPSNELLPNYLWYWFQNSYENVRDLARGGSQANLNLSILKKLKIPKPDLNLQQRFESLVYEYLQLKALSTTSLDKTDVLFKSLLSDAFTGELTSTWREQHQEELVAAIAERDQSLQISQPVDVEDVANEEASKSKISELHHDRYELLRSLSKSQREIYGFVIQETTYFTPEYLEEKHSISRSLAQKSLQLLAGTGLIVPITLPTLTSSGLRYELAYRNLNKDDNTQYTDDELLTKDAV
ncbi:restriction endonuclease subunit S [Dolichospermum sp. ST_sed1]|nr:restriction endonuclease subunit S [Dolichospermum sp. ST_sed1]MDD1424679.1 restriction endonuclease subunit S [Dolichospermum sp. ST_sed9]MDD1430904.1 restriction endonuclease subunit S [Dolichospermum sp. ST_sed6]MDD1439421.1 restriction endonuclease subunit S [Dolichospermum sp. ST_sed3]MDD1445448.1 restriction endonuclease subunit S [Dolichospermum sp. ST_sed8]MDD1458806.1 restriction endonuclease subunit S [Dolichospermum sp. ST_sed2]MDD1471840.1 restriction endonuclease subunit S [Do